MEAEDFSSWRQRALGEGKHASKYTKFLENWPFRRKPRQKTEHDNSLLSFPSFLCKSNTEQIKVAPKV